MTFCVFFFFSSSKGPGNLFGINNGSSWVRVKNFDVEKHFDVSWNKDIATASWYYDTNHFFGPGHWYFIPPFLPSFSSFFLVH
jgi:hypothetical protein